MLITVSLTNTPQLFINLATVHRAVLYLSSGLMSNSVHLLDQLEPPSLTKSIMDKKQTKKKHSLWLTRWGPCESRIHRVDKRCCDFHLLLFMSLENLLFYTIPLFPNFKHSQLIISLSLFFFLTWLPLCGQAPQVLCSTFQNIPSLNTYIFLPKFLDASVLSEGGGG